MLHFHFSKQSMLDIQWRPELVLNSCNHSAILEKWLASSKTTDCRPQPKSLQENKVLYSSILFYFKRKKGKRKDCARFRPSHVASNFNLKLVLVYNQKRGEEIELLQLAKEKDW
jgi:hypothetical protein